MTLEERAEAARLLEVSTQRGQAKAEQVRTHQAREAKRRQQRRTSFPGLAAPLAKPMPPVAFRKKCRFVPPPTGGKND